MTQKEKIPFPQELFNIDFELIKKPLVKLYPDMEDKIRRNFPDELCYLKGYKEFIAMSFMSSFNTFKVILELSRDSRKDDEIKYSLCVPVLARNILHGLFNVIYIIDKPDERVREFYLCGLADEYKKYQRNVDRYLNIPNQKVWLDQINRKRNTFGFSWDEIKEQSRWSSTRAMLKKIRNPEKRRSAEYLYEWFYNDLSKDDHLTWSGLVKGFPLIKTLNDNEKNIINKDKSGNIISSVIFLLSLLSEIQIAFKFNMNQDLRYIWTILNEVSGDSREIYRMRYSIMLENN